MNKLAFKIFGTFAGLVILINLIYWVWPQLAGEMYPEYAETLANVNTFHGFNWFFHKLSAFPGLMPYIKSAKDFANDVATIGNMQPEWTDLLSLLKIIVYPFRLIGTFLTTIALNIGWLFSFLEIIIL